MPKLLHAVQTMAGQRQALECAESKEIQKLLEDKAPLDESDENHEPGWTAYMWAVRCGLDHIARQLQHAGADTSRQGDALLIKAVFDEDVELARKALARGAHPDGRYAGETALGLAAMHGVAAVVELLVQAGTHVPQDALLHLGVMDVTDYKIENEEDERRYARVAEILLAQGASPHVNAYNGQPLITTFPEDIYPLIHRVLAEAMARPPGASSA